MSYQRIIIRGNVGRDAELQYTPQGIAVAKFSVAVTEVSGKGENRKEDTTWFNVVMWREKAENLTQFIKKGDKILVEGKVKVNAYTSKDGHPAASLELTASTIDFLTNKDDRSASQSENYEDTDNIPF